MTVVLEIPVQCRSQRDAVVAATDDLAITALDLEDVALGVAVNDFKPDVVLELRQPALDNALRGCDRVWQECSSDGAGGA